jgi:hypothetical protein
MARERKVVKVEDGGKASEGKGEDSIERQEDRSEEPGMKEGVGGEGNSDKQG